MPQSRKPLPEIVSIVVSEVEGRRARGELSETEEEMKLNRLAGEELKPRGLSLCRSEAGLGKPGFAVRGAGKEECLPIDPWTLAWAGALAQTHSNPNCAR